MHPLLIALAFVCFGQASTGFAEERVGVRVEYKHNDLQVHYNLGTEFGQPAMLYSEPNADKSWTVVVTPTRAEKGIQVKVEVTEDEKLVTRSVVVVAPGQSAAIRSSSDDGDSSEVKILATPESWGRPTKMLVYRFKDMDAKEPAAAAEKLLAAKVLQDPRVRVQTNPKTNEVIVSALPEDLGRVKAMFEGMESER